jgi:hypothetical protein
MPSVIQRLVAILMLSLLLLGAGAAVAGPDQGAGSTLELALEDSRDELTGGEAGLEAPEVAMAACASAMPRAGHSLAIEADSPVPPPPFLEGPQRPPRAA